MRDVRAPASPILPRRYSDPGPSRATSRAASQLPSTWASDVRTTKPLPTLPEAAHPKLPDFGHGFCDGTVPTSRRICVSVVGSALVVTGVVAGVLAGACASWHAAFASALLVGFVVSRLGPGPDAPQWLRHNVGLWILGSSVGAAVWLAITLVCACETTQLAAHLERIARCRTGVPPRPGQHNEAHRALTTFAAPRSFLWGTYAVVSQSGLLAPVPIPAFCAASLSAAFGLLSWAGRPPNTGGARLT